MHLQTIEKRRHDSDTPEITVGQLSPSNGEGQLFVKFSQVSATGGFDATISACVGRTPFPSPDRPRRLLVVPHRLGVSIPE